MKMKKNKKILVYTCGIDWNNEVGQTCAEFFPTVKDLKKNRSCWSECGIVEIELVLNKWIKKQNFKYL